MEIKELRINTKRFFLWNFLFFIKYIFTLKILFPIALLSAILYAKGFSKSNEFILDFLTLCTVAKIAFDVMLDTARGNMSTHSISNSFISFEVFFKVVLLGLFYQLFVGFIVAFDINQLYQVTMVLGFTFVTPAVLMLLALTGSVKIAVDPFRFIPFINVALISYCTFIVFWAISIYLFQDLIEPYIMQAIKNNSAYVISGLIKFLVLILNFHIMGYLLFQNREDFDLVAFGFKKVSNDIIALSGSGEMDPLVYQEIRRMLDLGEHERVFAIITELLARGEETPELSKLMKRASYQASYVPTSSEFAKKIHKLLKKNKVKQAFDKVAKHIESNNQYVEAYPEDIYPLINHASIQNKTENLPRLVENFAEKYPKHKDIVANYFLLAKHWYKNRTTRERAKENLINLVEKYPKDKNIAEVKSWLAGVQAMMNKPKRNYY